MSRHLPYYLSTALFVVFLALGLTQSASSWWWGAVVFGGLAVLGTYVLMQRKSTMRRK